MLAGISALPVSMPPPRRLMGTAKDMGRAPDITVSVRARLRPLVSPLARRRVMIGKVDISFMA